MSRHAQKYPGLYAATKAAGVSYNLVLSRVKNGMSLADAIAKPAGKQGRPRKVMFDEFLTHEQREAMYLARWKGLPWERPGYRKAKAKPVIRQRIIRDTQDTAPAHIRRIRSAFCDEFVKTGVINPELQAKLKGYADERRAAKEHSRRVSSEHASRRYSREAEPAGNDGSRDVAQVTAAAGDRIDDLLRT